jgi:hypothetical protein
LYSYKLEKAPQNIGTRLNCSNLKFSFLKIIFVLKFIHNFSVILVNARNKFPLTLKVSHETLYVCDYCYPDWYMMSGVEWDQQLILGTLPLGNKTSFVFLLNQNNYKI